MIKKLEEKIKTMFFALPVSQVKIENFLWGVISCGVYLTLVTPFIFSLLFYFPAVVPKVIFFRTIVDVILIAYVFLAILNSNYRPKWNAVNIAVTIFVGILCLTSITGINFTKSFWGDFERMGGLLTYFHLFAFFIIVSSVYKKRGDWENLFAGSILVSSFIVVYTLIDTPLSIANGTTLGNHSFLASYLLFNIFFAIILFLTKNIKWKILYGISLAGLIPALIFSGSKGAIAAFFAGLFLLILGYFLFLKRKWLKWFSFFSFLVLAAVVVLLFVPQQNFIKTASKTILESPTAQSRITVWQIGWQGWKDKFLLGWGLENFDVPFYKHFNPKLYLEEYGGEISFDRPHNIILDIGNSSGIIGVLSYLAIFAGVFFAARKDTLDPKDKKTLIFSGGLIIVLIVYFIQNLFVLDMISSFMLFFLILAFFAHNQIEKPAIDNAEKTKSVVPLWIGILLTLPIIPILYFANIQPLKASFYLGKGFMSEIEEISSIFQKALRASPMSAEEVNEIFVARMAFAASNQTENKKTIEKGFLDASKELNKSINKNPQEFYLYVKSGGLYNNFYQFSQDKKNLYLAEFYLNKAIELSPRNQIGYWTLANTKSFQGKYEEQFILLQKAIDLEPRLAKSHWALAIAYEKAGQEKMVEEKIKDIEKRNFTCEQQKGLLYSNFLFFINHNNPLAEFFLYRQILICNQGSLADRISPEYFKSDQQNANAWAALVIFYDYSKDEIKLKEALQKIKELDPALYIKLGIFLNND